MPARKKSLRRSKKGKKTRKIRRQKGFQRGGAPLATMPQLCFGTVQTPLKEPLTEAIKIGYRHIDGAEAYQRLHANPESPYISPIDYKSTLKEILSKFKIPLSRCNCDSSMKRIGCSRYIKISIGQSRANST